MPLPHGLIPESAARRQRIIDIVEAIKRYADADIPSPAEWVVELDELNTEWLKDSHEITVGYNG